MNRIIVFTKKIAALPKRGWRHRLRHYGERTVRQATAQLLFACCLEGSLGWQALLLGGEGVEGRHSAVARGPEVSINTGG